VKVTTRATDQVDGAAVVIGLLDVAVARGKLQQPSAQSTCKRVSFICRLSKVDAYDRGLI